MTQDTLKQLARSINLRDLGGVPAHGGAEVKRGVVYRSATLSGLSAEQLTAIRALGIRSVIDFRYNRERAVHPTPWQDMGCKHYWFRDYDPSGGGDLKSLLSDETLTAEKSRTLMIRVYEELPFGHIEALRRLFQTVVAGEGALLFHCTAGKDRTGMAAALILSALDAPREAILADYLATVEFEILASPGFRRKQAFPPEHLEKIRPIFAADGDYLDAMFSAIVKRAGSVRDFLYRTLELTDADLDALRKRLLA